MATFLRKCGVEFDEGYVRDGTKRRLDSRFQRLFWGPFPRRGELA
jgi:hypothetical protein